MHSLCLMCVTRSVPWARSKQQTPNLRVRLHACVHPDYSNCGYSLHDFQQAVIVSQGPGWVRAKLQLTPRV